MKLLKLFSVLLVFLIFGCKTPEGTIKILERSHSSFKKWLNIKEDKKFKYYIGFASNVESFEDGKDRAYRRAIIELITSLGVAYHFDPDKPFPAALEGIPVQSIIEDIEIENFYYEKFEEVGYFLDDKEIDIKYNIGIKIRYPKDEWKRRKHYNKSTP